MGNDNAFGEMFVGILGGMMIHELEAIGKWPVSSKALSHMILVCLNSYSKFSSFRLPQVKTSIRAVKRKMQTIPNDLSVIFDFSDWTCADLNEITISLAFLQERCASKQATNAVVFNLVVSLPEFLRPVSLIRLLLGLQPDNFTDGIFCG